MRELVPDHVLMMDGYEQVSSSTVDINHYSPSSSASSSSTSLPLLPHPMHPALASQHHLINPHSMRVGSHHHGMHNSHAMPLKSLYHQDPMVGNSNGGDSSSGLLLTGGIGITGHRTHYDGLGGDIAGGATHGSGSNGMSVGSGDMYNGNYPQYMHPDIAQGMTNANSVLHGQHGHWAPFSGRQPSGLYIDQDQSTMGYMSATSPGTFPAVFPVLTSLSSSLPDGISPRLNEKVQLPLPIRTTASENSNIANSRPPTTGTVLTGDPASLGYGAQTLQPSYRGYAPWGGDTSFSPPQPSSTISSAGIPPLPVPSLNTYGSHNNTTFPLASSNSSLLPSTSHNTSILSNSPLDSFSTQCLPHAQQQQKHRSGSESSSGSKATTPTQTPIMRTDPTSSSSYSPSYSRSNGGYYR